MARSAAVIVGQSVGGESAIGDIDRMAVSWQRHLRAENKAAQTLTAYGYAVSQVRDFLVAHVPDERRRDQ